MTITLHAWHGLVALLVVGIAVNQWAGDAVRPREAVMSLAGAALALLALGALIGRLIP